MDAPCRQSSQEETWNLFSMSCSFMYAVRSAGCQTTLQKMKENSTAETAGLTILLIRSSKPMKNNIKGEKNMRTISVINLKGGVAKTTSSINIAYILTQRGYKVLLVDNDKQGDCSRGLNRRTIDGDGIDRIMLDRHPDMENLIHKTDYDNLDIITANLGLLTANMEVTMDRVRPQQNRLKKALQQVAERYDFCVVDNAPDINISVINALTAANDVLVPVEVDDNTLEGMKELLEQIEEVKEELNPELQNVKCFVSKYQRLNEAHIQGAEVIQEYYPTMHTKIRASAVVARSTFARTPVALYSPRSAAAEDYEKLVTEYLNMIGGNENVKVLP